MKYRILTKTLKKAITTFPAVVVTGPRQSGKTTLLKSLFSRTHAYYNLENPDVRLRAKDDPKSFLNHLKLPVIIDEMQYVPELVSFIKDRIDKKRKPGEWLMAGSQNFILMQGVSESLAGRAAVLSLLPFTLAERLGRGETSKDVTRLLGARPQGKDATHAPQALQELIMRGNYPEIASNRKVDRNLWCGSYITTYLERDIRTLTHVGDLAQFERFLRICATRTGQILNISDFARDVGTTVTTAKRWLSLMETGYQIYLLYPYYRNIGKRLVKSPKLYFNDTALVCYLLRLQDDQSLLNSPYFPALFETMIVTDFYKRFLHFGQLPSLYYLKTRDGLEVDLAVELNQKLHLFEIKSSATITPQHAASVGRARNDLDALVASAGIISLDEERFMVRDDIVNHHWLQFLSL